jgi:hypothetical protein
MTRQLIGYQSLIARIPLFYLYIMSGNHNFVRTVSAQ